METEEMLRIFGDCENQVKKSAYYISKAKPFCSEPYCGICLQNTEAAYGALANSIFLLSDVVDSLNHMVSKEAGEEIERMVSPSLPESMKDLAECRYITPDIFHCLLKIRPVVKGTAAARKYENLFYKVIPYKISECQKESGIAQFERYKTVFVSHVKPEHAERPVYNDNDNLSIKIIMDIILHRVAIDDAAIFGDNLYITERDTEEPFCEIFVVNDGHFRDWLERFSDYRFAAEILGKT